MKLILVYIFLLFISNKLYAYHIEKCIFDLGSGDTEALLLVDSSKEKFFSADFLISLESYGLDLIYFSNLSRVKACYIHSNTDPEIVKKTISNYISSLKGVVFIGDFKAPKIKARESRSYSFEYVPPDLTSSYYYYSDFITDYERIEKNNFSCGDCTDDMIIRNSSIILGLLPSYREDGKDLIHYFKRLSAFRRLNHAPYSLKLNVSRSGFDTFDTLMIFNDNVNLDTTYPSLANAMGFTYDFSTLSSKAEKYPFLDKLKLNSLKSYVVQQYTERSSIFISVMHGNERYAGGNSAVGAFLSADDNSHLLGGSLLSVFHSCRTGLELAPRSLVYFDDDINSSSRLGIIAPIDDVHKFAILPNNLVLLQKGFLLGEVSKSITNNIEITLFGDPFLIYKNKKPNFSSYIESLLQTGLLLNPRLIIRALPLFSLDTEDIRPILNDLTSSTRSSVRAAALNSLDALDIYHSKDNLLMDPNPLVRFVFTKKLYSLGLVGTKRYDEFTLDLPRKILQRNRRQDLEEKYFFLHNSFN